MGLFDFFTGTKRPAAGTPPALADDVKAAILGVNRETAPFQIMPDDSGKGDFMAEWKVVDAKWHEIFAKAGLQKTFRIYMKLDPLKHEVRAVDEEYTVSWRAGVPTIALAVSKFRGQKQEVSFGAAYAFTEEFNPGEVYNYRFNTNEIKKPLQEAVTSNGWTWRGVGFGKL